MASKPEKLKTYKDEISTALKELTLQSFHIMTYRLQDLDMDDISCKLYLIKRRDINDVGSRFEITYITDHIRSRLAICMRNYDGDQQINFYRNFAFISATRRVLASQVFELFLQQHFQRRIFIDYTPMVRLDQPEGDRQRKLQWHTSHDPIKNQELETKRQIALHYRATLDVHPSGTCNYDDQDFRRFVPTPDIYYVPMRENSAVMDPFIYHDGYLFIFRFTASEEHSIDTELISQLNECASFPPRSNWRFVFIISDDVKVLKCRYSRSCELQELELNPFSSKVKMEDHMTEASIAGLRDSADNLPLLKKRKFA